uniref:CN hydrolase domain-containing protein n=1 Tax=Aegilops tauschii subsp. strangulata TaxID=200361 RepID=A0A453R2Q3_AEGTS
EIWSCPYAMQTMRSYAEDIDGGRSPSVSMLSEVAAARKITIVGGSIPEMVPASGQLFNTCCVVGPDGEIKAKHRKVKEPGLCRLLHQNFRMSPAVTHFQGDFPAASVWNRHPQRHHFQGIRYLHCWARTHCG